MLTLLAVNTKNLFNALEITWKGMLAIFVVMAIIYFVIIILNKVTVLKKEDIRAFFKKIFSVFRKK